MRAKHILAKFHEHIANQRKDFQFKQVFRLFQRADLIAIEDLKVSNMIKNKHLSKSIADVGWSGFRIKLVSKAESAGLRVEAVNPKNTSQQCCVCGIIVKKSLADRVHRCHNCKIELDRDHNAAINILARGIEQYKAAVALHGEFAVVNALVEV